MRWKGESFTAVRVVKVSRGFLASVIMYHIAEL